MFQNQSSLARAGRLFFAGFAVLLAVLYDFLVWDKALGLGFFLYIMVCIAGFVILCANTKHLKEKYALLLAVPIAAMSAGVLFFNNELVRYWVPLFVLIQLIMFALVLTLYNPERHKFSLLKLPLFTNHPFFLFEKMRPLWLDLFRWSKNEDNKNARNLLIGFLVALPLLIIFTALFSAADAIFAAKMKALFDFELEGMLIWRIIRTILLSAFIGAFFYLLVGGHAMGQRQFSIRRFEVSAVSVVLFLVNALFLAFVFIQIKYLFGSASYVFDKDLTFAEYARSGFFELAWVMAIAGALVLAVYRSFSHHKASTLVTALQLLLIVQVGVIAVSALKRMNLYQDIFGFTVLRLYVEWFIYFTLALLLFSGISLVVRFHFRPFFYTSVIAGLAALSVVALINVDYVIAKENVRRFAEEKKELDFEYLRQLSPDVVPALAPLARPETWNALSEEEKENLSITLLLHRNARALLRNDWRELNIFAQKSQKALENISEEQWDIMKFYERESKLRADAVSCAEELWRPPNETVRRCRLTQYGGSKLFVYGLSFLVPDGRGRPVTVWVIEEPVYSFDAPPPALKPLLFEKEIGVQTDKKDFMLLLSGAIVESDKSEWKHYEYRITRVKDQFILRKRQPLILY